MRNAAPRRRSSRQDVVAHRRRIALHLPQAMLDHVADRHHAGQPALVDDGHMAEFARGHALHDRRHRLALVTGGDFAGHRSAHRLVECRRAALGERPHNVAFGENADDAGLAHENEQRTDTLLGEQRDCLCPEDMALGSMVGTSQPLAREDGAAAIIRQPSLCFTTLRPLRRVGAVKVLATMFGGGRRVPTSSQMHVLHRTACSALRGAARQER